MGRKGIKIQKGQKIGSKIFKILCMYLTIEDRNNIIIHKVGLPAYVGISDHVSHTVLYLNPWSAVGGGV